MAHQVVAIERDIERSGRHGASGDLLQLFGEPPREVLPPRPDPYEREVVQGAIALHDFVCDPGERAAHAVRIHHHGHGKPSTLVTGAT